MVNVLSKKVINCYIKILFSKVYEGLLVARHSLGVRATQRTRYLVQMVGVAEVSKRRLSTWKFWSLKHEVFDLFVFG